MKITVSPKEQVTQKECQDYLSYTGWFVFKINNVGIYKKSTGKYIPAQTKGISDLVACKDGTVLFIEVKTEKGKLTASQKVFQENILNQNCHYLVARKWQDIEDYIGKLETLLT